ncbi:latent-transforming growth factor beta-binding protein 1 isoform X1 [Anguilla rostrata]|uniref:latent-transforming growth factor beta-binding protein 1 isoform X1 n=1 Tax=Anguilla rostrata TaxID=7938 RepID=UPI0030CE692D
MDCPQGYKRVNNSYCQDINECQLQGVCPNGVCVNAMGSFRCSCKPGFIPDSSLRTCIPDTPAVREEKGACFRLVGLGKQCLHPVSVQLSKQLCCCSVGKAWGPRCDKCPSPGTAAFKEICPGGMGYTVTGTYRPKPVNPPDSRPRITHEAPQVPPLPLPTVQRPVEALSVTERQLPDVPVVTAAPEEELVTLGVSNNSVVEPGQPQLSPGVSTIRMEPAYPEVVEKTSPPAPVEILPSSASQDIAPTQLAEVDECLVSPVICGPGVCINSADGYTCICDYGYQLDEEGTTCVDVDECAQGSLVCANGRCRNTDGSFRCVCQSGFAAGEEGTSCVDVDECLTPGVCGDEGFCVNSMGSYTCRHCEAGYKMTPTGHCADVNECLDQAICPSGMCTNTHGSYECEPCPEGFEGKGGQCVDVDECLDPSACANGQCSNFEGYFVCACHRGYRLGADGRSCADVDECWDERICSRGHCQNTEGSFICSCGPGFKVSLAGDQCDDVDECQELVEPCGSVGQCVNNMGSYHCSCPQGYQQVNGTSCQDVDECLDDPELCGPHGECLNTEGSFQCDCGPGFTANQDTRTCEDVDECTLLGQSICGAWRCENTPGSYKCVVNCPPGHALGPNGFCADVDECARNSTACGPHGFCENAIGSFRCACDRGFQESPDGLGCVDVNECELLSGVCGEALCDNVEGAFMCVCPKENQEYNQMTAKCSPAPTVSSVERKECYYNLNDENLCENVLTSSVTMEECCCTLGAGWGDNCEVHPCPVQGTDQFAQMCPAGKGSVPTGDSIFGTAASSHKDADECVLFSQEICKDGFCLNTAGSYECYCKQGLYYDEVKLQCLDIDECLDESTCGGSGQCMNSHGSYMCFCNPPMMLNPDSMRCESAPTVSEPAEQTDIYQDICWQTVTQESLTCTSPLTERKTTYTECCCLYGEAWGMDCALCPRKDSESYATMCNMPHGQGRRPYGRDALPPSEHDYPVHEVPPEYGSQSQSPRYLPDYENQEHAYDAFEGLRADECGILNGCENGRCVRVQEGYTCDCFHGYTLDMSRMACVDVNECSELKDDRMSPCHNGKCVNTQGSYKCVCLPGFEASDRPNYCVPGNKEAAAAAATAAVSE